MAVRDAEEPAAPCAGLALFLPTARSAHLKAPHRCSTWTAAAGACAGRTAQLKGTAAGPVR